MDERDAVSAAGVEIWNLLEERGIVIAGTTLHQQCCSRDRDGFRPVAMVGCSAAVRNSAVLPGWSGSRRDCGPYSQTLRLTVRLPSIHTIRFGRPCQCPVPQTNEAIPLAVYRRDKLSSCGLLLRSPQARRPSPSWPAIRIRLSSRNVLPNAAVSGTGVQRRNVSRRVAPDRADTAHA